MFKIVHTFLKVVPKLPKPPNKKKFAKWLEIDFKHNFKMLTFGPFKKELGFWTQLIKVNILSNNFGKNFKYPGAICAISSQKKIGKMTWNWF